MKKITSFFIFLATAIGVQAQEIVLDKQAAISQAFLKTTESKTLLPMNDLDMESGYVLYETDIELKVPKPVLELENVRDYAAVFLDDELQGTLTDSKKKLVLNNENGMHKLRLYVENIGRITYGPEILDNSKGLFGNVTLNGDDLENWNIIPLNIRKLDPTKLTFETRKTDASPCFLKGEFNVDQSAGRYLDISGWGMGEVWINGKYVGAYWEEEKQQAIQLSADVLKNGKNEIVVFELKNLDRKKMKLTSQPVFH